MPSVSLRRGVCRRGEESRSEAGEHTGRGAGPEDAVEVDLADQRHTGDEGHPGARLLRGEEPWKDRGVLRETFAGDGADADPQQRAAHSADRGGGVGGGRGVREGVADGRGRVQEGSGRGDVATLEAVGEYSGDRPRDDGEGHLHG